MSKTHGAELSEVKLSATRRKWLPYFEAALLLLFIVLVFWHTTGGKTQAPPPPLPQAQEFIKRGDEYFAKQDLGKAIIEYWRAIQAIEAAKSESPGATSGLNESLLHAHLRVAEIYFHSHWSEDARSHLERAAQIDPDYPGVHLLRGKLLRDDGETALAVQELLTVLKKEPSHAEAHYYLGVLYQGAKQYKEALAHYEKAVENDPELEKLPFESAPIGLQARLQLSRTYRRLIQDYQFTDRSLTAAEQAEVGKMEDKGIAVLEEAVRKDANYAEAKQELIGLLYGRAAALGREGGKQRPYDEALKVYEHIVALDQTEVDAWQWIGQINNSFMQDPEAALEAYKKAYQLHSDPGILAEIKSIEQDLKNVTNQ